jgi:hypothetical protein
MKKHIILALVAITFLVTINGCKKETIPTPNPIINLLVDEEPQALVTELETTLTSPETTDMSVGDVSITDYPAFLDYDPFTVVMTRTKSVDSCLKGLEVTKAEKEHLNKAFLTKLECQKANKTTIARIHRDIEYWAKVTKMKEMEELIGNLYHEMMVEERQAIGYTTYCIEKTSDGRINTLSRIIPVDMKVKYDELFPTQKMDSLPNVEDVDRFLRG